MKIKSDFVTNSSSTAYIVAIPQEFVPTDEEIKEAYDFQILYAGDEEVTDEQLYKELKFELFDFLKEGDNLWNYGEDGTHHILFGMAAEICMSNDFVLSLFSISGEGHNRIQGIKEEDINKWFINTKLDKLKIEVDDE